jgi:cell division protein FtsB
MFPIGGVIKAIVALVIVAVIAFGLWYVTGLRADLAVSQENEKKMVAAVEQQQEVIAQIQADQRKINQLNAELADTIKRQNKDLVSLQDRFTTSANGESRDFGAMAAAKPKSIERAINTGTINAMRCIEIATGAPLTEKETNAKLPSEINKECPSLANPNYVPAAN